MKQVLVLGAGMVARPLVEYLLAQPDLAVEVLDIIPDKARLLVAGHQRGKAGSLDLDDPARLETAIGAADLVVSLAPNVYHPKVAAACLKLRKHLVTASYVGEAMRALDAEARRTGLVFLNEMGLDPGIDHMESMRIIHDLRGRGGQIREFVSYCGGLPVPDDQSNPWRYKFSWSPIGVLRAGNSAARYRNDGREILVPAEKLFDECAPVNIEGLPEFEGYPNRDSLQYIELYGIPETRTMLRGTLRYKGWCRTLKAVRTLGLLDETPQDWSGETCEGFLRRVMKLDSGSPLRKAVCAALSLAEDSDVIGRLDWLGLFGSSPLPLARGSAIETLAGLMAEKLRYEPGERDLVVLRHTFVADFPGGRAEKILSTLVDFGIPGGDTSMARTVGLPSAIGARLILSGEIRSPGVQIPVRPEIYEPVLKELRDHGISFQEERLPL
jgi:saccharopine dehydrogenase (NADP+, L-glutamate forming)